ncbi:MAG: hypothetical protein ACR2PG_11320, partial [Hyphomicrobiaceae bacterium]
HIAIYIADFSGPYRKLVKRSLISLESNQHEYRFVDIVDLDTGSTIFQIEHEVRSMRHPVYARRLVNRDPSLTVHNFLQSQEDLAPVRN